MFHIQNVPIAIEPGVAVIEADFVVAENHREKRAFPVRLSRVEIDGVAIGDLPFIPSTRTPHVFSLTTKPAESVVLLLYDAMGRIDTVYTRDETGKSWEKRGVADEHVGKVIKQFSIRYFFGSEKTRDEFMNRVDSIIGAMHRHEPVSEHDVKVAFSLLSRSRSGPVVLPVAVAKSNVRKVKI